ncbi:MAG TPA: hypothetical protein PLK67_05435 [Bryobacteraceae bacterium]|nr:hypothetical protein [Bryobacteraceae bacterium]HOL71348.1 hypothetical protein [Bryobacteraceae bacterium]
MAQAVRATGGRLAWNAVGMARPSQVRRRVEAVLDESRRLSVGMTRARWAAVLLCAVPLAYGAAAVQFEAAVPIAKQELWAPGSYMESVLRGNKLTPEEAQRLEAHVQANPEDLAARSSLIVYYTLKGLREPRLRHIFWFIENHPESEFAGYHATAIYPFRNQLNSEADYAHARSLWLEQVRRA